MPLTFAAVDGNSIPAGLYITGGRAGLQAALASRSAIANAYTPANVAQSGQTFADMLANHADLDATYIAGRVCAAVLWEIINTVWFGLTGAQAYALLLNLIAALRAVHPEWKIVVVTGAYRYQTPPEGSPWTIRTCNQQIDACNQLVRDGAGANGYLVADVRRSGSPFNFANDGTVESDYSGSGLYSNADGAGIWVHFTDTGFVYPLDRINEQLLIAFSTSRFFPLGVAGPLPFAGIGSSVEQTYEPIGS